MHFFVVSHTCMCTAQSTHAAIRKERAWDPIESFWHETPWCWQLIPHCFISNFMWYKASESHSTLTLPNNDRKPHVGNVLISNKWLAILLLRHTEVQRDGHRTAWVVQLPEETVFSSVWPCLGYQAPCKCKSCWSVRLGLSGILNFHINSRTAAKGNNPKSPEKGNKSLACEGNQY